MGSTPGRMIRASREEKPNRETLEKHSRPVRNERKQRSCVRQPPRLHAGRAQERPGPSGRTCQQLPPAASTIDHGGTPRHRGQLLVRTWGLAWSRPARLICATFLCCAVFSFTSVAAQQLDGSQDKPVPAKSPAGKPEPPGKVEIQPVAKDGEIGQRIGDILKTTGWFGEPKVTVEDGIVFLKGTTENDGSKQWAGDLAKNTEGVVAVVNQIEVDPTTIAQNLLVNALEHTSHGEVRLIWKRDAIRWLLQVRDTGPGMQDQLGLRVAQELDHRDADRYPELRDAPFAYSGEGIGLSIVKRLCGLLDVEVALSLRRGQGTDFTVKFPLGYD